MKVLGLSAVLDYISYDEFTLTASGKARNWLPRSAREYLDVFPTLVSNYAWYYPVVCCCIVLL